MVRLGANVPDAVAELVVGCVCKQPFDKVAHLLGVDFRGKNKMKKKKDKNREKKKVIRVEINTRNNLGKRKGKKKRQIKVPFP